MRHRVVGCWMRTVRAPTKWGAHEVPVVLAAHINGVWGFPGGEASEGTPAALRATLRDVWAEVLPEVVIDAENGLPGIVGHDDVTTWPFIVKVRWMAEEGDSWAVGHRGPRHILPAGRDDLTWWVPALTVAWMGLDRDPLQARFGCDAMRPPIQWDPTAAAIARWL